MKNFFNYILILFATVLITACGGSDGGGSSPAPIPPGTLGQLSNGSYVTSSANNIAAGNGQSAKATISLNGGTTDNFLFTFDATNNASASTANASVQSVPGIVITPSTCNLGTSGSGFSSSCEITVTVAPTVPSNTYYIYPTVSGQKALSPITILVSNSQTDSSKSITSFMINGVDGTVQNNMISVTLPYATNLNSLVATYITTGKSVTVNGQVQTNGVTPNDFTNSVATPVIYTVTAEDGSTQNYKVSVTTSPNTAKQITSFNIGDNQGVIIGNNIGVQVTHGVSLTNLVATFTTTGAKVVVNNVEQQNGLTQNDFTNPVTYTVYAADGSTQNYTVTVTNAPASDKAITSFEVNGPSNPVFINEDNHTINATLPFDSDLTNVTVDFDISGTKMTVGGNEVTSGYAQDFTNPVVYTVTAQDGTTQDYTVTVTTAPDHAKTLVNFSLNGYAGIIDNNNILVQLPYGTDLSSVIADFDTTGAFVTVNGVTQTSGKPVNFANDKQTLVYTVHAADGSTNDYTVRAEVAKNSAKDITLFNIGNDIGTITGNNIGIQVAYNVSLTNLTATFTTTGASVSVNGVKQNSDVTQNDFTNPVVYTVTAEDGTTQDYTVTVTNAPAPDKAITSFEVNGPSNPVLIDEDDHIINAMLPFGADLTHVTVNFDISGVKMSVGDNEVISGYSQDFTNPVVYTVTAEDGSTQDYTVTVTTSPNHAKEITTFALNGFEGTIINNNITVQLPFGTDLSTLIADFDTTGRAVTVNDVEQVSGGTVSFANDKQSLVYTVYAADGSTNDYTVTAVVAKDSHNDMLSFAIGNNIGTFTGQNVIVVTVPFGVPLNNLVATFTTNGAKVLVNNKEQQSEVTANNFEHLVTYVVEAANGDKQNYSVFVQNAPSEAKEITAIKFNGNDFTQGIDQENHTIFATLPFGTDITRVQVNFDTSGKSVSVNGSKVISGYIQNFTNPVVYTVTAQNGSTQTYTATVAVAGSNAKAFSTFSLDGNVGVINESQHTINITAQKNVDLTTAIATFTTTGKTVLIGATEQVSGITVNNFNNDTKSLIYTVYAADNSTQDYTVSVDVLPRSWQYVGNPRFAGESTFQMGMALNPATNQPYVLFRNVSTANLSVMRFNGESWVYVGSPSFVQNPGTTAPMPSQLIFNPVTNEPYVVYNRYSPTGSVEVMKFNGSTWVTVGQSLSRYQAAQYSPVLAISKTGECYLSYIGENDTVQIYKFNGTSWVSTGDLTGLGHSSNNAPYITFDNNNKLYGVFKAKGTFSTVVQQFNNGSWSMVGESIISTAQQSAPMIAFKPSNNQAYLITAATTGGNSATQLYTLENGTWNPVGAVLNDISYGLNIVFNPVNDQLYIASTYTYGNMSSTNLKIQTFDTNSNTWSNVGNIGVALNTNIYVYSAARFPLFFNNDYDLFTGIVNEFNSSISVVSYK